MFRLILPAVFLCANLTTPANAQGVCNNIPYSQKNCVRVLACVGDAGVTFDGQARGWDTGSVTGTMSDGTACSGTWTSDGPLGTGFATMTCDNTTTIDVLYYSQDGITGTTIGRGTDSTGRPVQAWSGKNVLQFLTGPGAFGPALPCVQGDIPVS